MAYVGCRRRLVEPRWYVLLLQTTPRDADRGDDPRLGAGCERSTLRCRGVSPAAKRPGSPAMKNPLRGSLRFDLTKKVRARSYGQDETPSPRCGVFSRCC